MEKIGIITDTNSGLSAEEARSMGIQLLPMPFTVDGEDFFENVNMTQAEFFRRLEEGACVATSQPAPGDVTGCWDAALRDHEEVIYIPMSSALSSACESARLFAGEYGGRVHVVDNRRISISQKQSAIDAAHWRDAGLSADEIERRLMATALDASIYLTVDDLQYLKRGGRITPSVAAIGTVFQIKPVLKIQGGRLDVFRKVRGLHAAQNAMLDAIRADLDTRFAGVPMHLRSAYAGNPEMGREWNARVQARFPEFEVTGDPLPISIACHVGPGVTALGIFRKI